MQPGKKNNDEKFNLILNPNFIFILIALIGFILRLVVGSGVSFCSDEGPFAYVISVKNFFQLGQYYNSHTTSDHPFLVYILIYFWKMFSSSPSSLRLCSILFSTLGIFFSGFLCFKITKGKLLSAIVAILVAVSPLSIRYSYEITPYFLVSFFAPLSFFLFIEQINKREHFPSRALMWANGLFLNTHYFSWFVVLSQMTIFLFFDWKNGFRNLKKNVVSSAIFLAVAVIPFALLFKPDVAQPMQDWIEKSPRGFLDIFITTIAYTTIAQVLFFSVFLYAVIFFMTRIKTATVAERNIVFVSSAYIILPLILISISQSLTWKILGNERYLMVLFPVLLFLVAYTIVKNFDLKRVGIILAVLITVFSMDLWKAQPIQVENFRSAFGFLGSKTKNSITFMVPDFSGNIFSYYNDVYHLESTYIPHGLLKLVENEDETKKFVEELKIKSIRTVFLYHTFVDYRKDYIKFLVEDYFPRNFKLASKYTFRGIEIYEFQLPDQNTALPKP